MCVKCGKLVNCEFKAGAVLTKETLRMYLIRQITLTVTGEGGMLWLAQSLEYGFDDEHAGKKLPGGNTAESAAKIVWEKGRGKDIHRFGMDQGRLQEFWAIAKMYDIELPEEVIALDWREAMEPV